jgi:hypothetical protein
MTDHQDFPGTRLNPVQFSRLTRRTLLLGLSIPQLLVLGIGSVAFVATLYAAGGRAIVWSTPIWMTGLILALVRVRGRPLVEWLPITGSWVRRTVADQRRYRSRVFRPRPAGTLALPGDAAALRQSADPTTGAVMVHDPHAGTLTAILGVTHPAFVLLDPAEQQRRVIAWGRVLAGTCRSGRIARFQVLESTLPDSGTDLNDWWTVRGVDDGSWTAATYRQLIDRAGPASERHRTTISIALDLRAAARQVRAAGGGIPGGAAVLRQEMANLNTAVRAADLSPTGWLTPADLAVVLRTAYDPAAALRLDRHEIGRDLATAGPLAVVETWDRLRTDSAVHAVLWISEWPRTQVVPGFLAPLLLMPGVRRTFSITCTPVRVDLAFRDIRRKKTGLISDANQRAKIGQVEDAAHTAAYRDVLQQEQELTSGHGILRYTGLIAVTAPTAAELDAAVASIEQAAVQACCETRRLVGQQAQAFAVAALPLCRQV